MNARLDVESFLRGKGVIMDQQNKETSSGTQSSRKTSGFKIPKKKPEDWCEDIQASSPLSKLQDDDFRNVRHSSYEEYNSHAYNRNTLRFDRQPKIILMDILRSGEGKQAAHKNISDSVSCNDGNFQINPVSSASYIQPPATTNVCLSRAPRISFEQYREREIGTKNGARSPANCKEQTQEYPSSKVCRDVSNTSISFGPRKYNSLDQESQGVSKVHEQKSALKGNEISQARRERTYCLKRAEHQSKKMSLSPSSTDPSSSSTESFTDRTLSCTLESPGRKDITRQKIKETAEENKNSSDDGCSSDTQRFRSQSVAYSRTRSKVFATSDSVEAPPIVLSSDEDESAQKESKPGCSHTVRKTSEQRKNPCPTKDVEPMEHSGIVEDANSAPEQSDSPVLQLKLLNIYYGKTRGRATESAKLTATSIEIPFKVPLHPIACLSLETRKLQKYGLWLTKGSDFGRSSAIIILWMTPNYVPIIERQMELYAKNQASKSNEFIFLELVEPFTSKEQSLMSEVMVEASKHGSSSLAEAFSWEEMYSMLESLPECSFKSNCYSVGSQPPEAKKVKSTYRLMQKWSDGQFSLSMVPENHDVLGEAHRSGIPIRLLVYPPPPTKGGLAVSNEDLECLEHGEFLNDVIIDFYLKYLMLEIFPKPFADRCHVFSSFFFKCLTRKENGSSDNNPDKSTAERRHQSVKNWTRHVDIFTKDFIFVPINENSHWYLAVICFPWLEKAVYEDKKEQDVVPYSKTKDRSSSGSVIVFNDRLSKTEEAVEDSNSGSEGSCSSGRSSNINYSKPKESHIGKVCKRPCILIFDSLTTGSVRTTVQVLRDYLKVECRVKKKLQREFSRSSMRELIPKVPKQNNSTDCGLYLLQYVESFSQKPIENFETPLHLENWFPSYAVRNKREKIRDLILRLHVEQTKKS
ncbi:sentrin-specific protease 7 isoform X2 [Rana temporaria]|uniref:sentrin-specific protease 7 isoform X2 n=1 Tax=Rana temporaria TaxID=8407 RepID=UPI001AADF9CB|nr:sentrin-specific protease 7 isoform X2 [Rana temporaria]